MIPAMIIKLIPFPIPFWVIWSPNHNRKDVPAVKTIDIYKYSIGVPVLPIKAKAKAYPSIKAKIITPILEKLIDDSYSEEKKELINNLIEENEKEAKKIDIRFGEV